MNDSLPALDPECVRSQHARVNKMQKLPVLDTSVIDEILEYPGLYSSSEEEETCRRMVLELTFHEQEIAARTSYAYWLYSLTRVPSDELRIRTAMKEARRHALRRTYARGMESLRLSVKFREVRLL